VRKCLELLPQDKELDIRTKLADALLSQYAEEGIEPVREMVERRAYDSMDTDLMRKLVALSTALGVTFPEYPIWKRETEDQLAKQERRMRETWEGFQAPAKPLSPPKTPPARHDVLERKPTPFHSADKHVGRNDPCPCGSGKKFKKCCMNRSK
jgi:preprotein translocase subunit SecA